MDASAISQITEDHLINTDRSIFDLKDSRSYGLLEKIHATPINLVGINSSISIVNQPNKKDIKIIN
jgi:hypothetical protein